MFGLLRLLLAVWKTTATTENCKNLNVFNLYEIKVNIFLKYNKQTSRLTQADFKTIRIS